MKKNRYVITLSVVFSIACLLIVSTCSVFAYWTLQGCLYFDCPPKRNFTVYDMNIPKGYLPEEQFIKLRYDRNAYYGAMEKSSGSAEWQNGQAIYIALKLGAEKEAINWFAFDSRQNKFLPNLTASEAHKNILKHKMPNASDYQVQCGSVPGDFRCIFNARYEEFYIFFSASVGKNVMSDEDYIKIMDYIDTRINSLLNSGN